MAQYRAWSILVVLALVAGACGSDAGPGDSTRPSTTAAGGATSTTESTGDLGDVYGEIGADDDQPGSVALTLETTTAATGEIGPEGGTLAATSAAGVTFTLTIPAEALFAPVMITITPIASVVGEPVGDTPTAAVHLAPEGLAFLKPVELAITGFALDSEPIGIGASGAGEDFHLLPATDAGDGTVTVTTMHFSSFGVAGRSQLEALVRNYRPSGAEQLARTALAFFGDDHPRAFGALEIWARAFRGTLSGTSDARGLETRTVEMLSLLGAIADQLRLSTEDGIVEPPESLIAVAQDIIDLWFERVGAEVDRLSGVCMDTPAEAFWIYRWVSMGTAISEMLTLERRTELEGWLALAADCLEFEVEWTADVWVEGSASPASTTRAAGVATLPMIDLDENLNFFDGEIRIGGEGDWVITHFAIEDCSLVLGPTGTVRALLHVEIDLSNLGIAHVPEITGFGVVIGWSQTPHAGCDETGAMDWGAVYFSLPVARMNAERAGDAGIIFVVPATSQTGEMGSIEVQNSAIHEGGGETMTQKVTVKHVPGG